MENQAFVQDVIKETAVPVIPNLNANDYIIGDPALYWLTQRDNTFQPAVTCFPTSMAMVITFLLLNLGKTEVDIGIPDGMQIEDYLARTSIKPTMINWMLKTVGRWTQSYMQRAWTVAKVEEKEFDDLMGALGYDAELIEGPTFDEVCGYVSNEEIPQVISGNFSKFSRVQGHITCVAGFNAPNGELIINDPYGYAYDGYKTTNGVGHRYKWRDFYGLSANQTAPWMLHIFQRS